MKNKHLSIRISDELYQKYIDEAIKRSVVSKKMVKVSEIIRETLEVGLK